MNTVVVRPLRPYEKKQLRRMKRQRVNAVNCRHARIILLSRGHVPNREIAARVDCTPTWVRHIIHRFNEDGLGGIMWYPWWQTRDTPRKFLADVREQIAEVASSPPKRLIGMNQDCVSARYFGWSGASIWTNERTRFGVPVILRVRSSIAFIVSVVGRSAL